VDKVEKALYDWAEAQINKSSLPDTASDELRAESSEVLSPESLQSFPVRPLLKALSAHISKHFGIKVPSPRLAGPSPQ
jgi:hypothetical protein